MAKPEYSIVIVETTVTGVTTHAATAYVSQSAAKTAYVAAINAGHRSYLYQKPIPTNFHRNDTQPLAAS